MRQKVIRANIFQLVVQLYDIRSSFEAWKVTGLLVSIIGRECDMQQNIRPHTMKAK